MTKEQYENQIKALIASHKEAVGALQKEYAENYKVFRPGDLIRGTSGWKSYFRVKKVKHYAEGYKVYTVLTVTTVNRFGEEHARSCENTVSDEDVIPAKAKQK